MNEEKPKDDAEIEKMGAFNESAPISSNDGSDVKDLPDISQAITDELIGQSFLCPIAKQVFTFTKQELDFYRKHNLPLPDLYPEERNRRRFKKMAPPVPRIINCPGCSKKITTYYPKDWGYERMGCEDCYLKTVY